MRLATQVYAPEFDHNLAALHVDVRRQITAKIDELSQRLEVFPHCALTGSASFRLRVGDYRVIYEFDVPRNEL